MCFVLRAGRFVVRQPHPIDNPPLLLVGDTTGVEPVCEPVGGAGGGMADKGRGEVLRGACAFTLGDEPLTGRMEHRALERGMICPELGIDLDHLVH